MRHMSIHHKDPHQKELSCYEERRYRIPIFAALKERCGEPRLSSPQKSAEAFSKEDRKLSLGDA